MSINIELNERFLARFLVGEDPLPSEEFLSKIEALLQEKIHLFEQNPNRDNAILLVLFTNISWNIIRAQKGLKGDDKIWFKENFLPDNYEQLKEEFGYNDLDCVIEIIDALKFVFDLHTFIRHPDLKRSEFDFFLNDKWPEDELAKILFAAKRCLNILAALYGTCWNSD